MVLINKMLLCYTPIICICLLILTGCPGFGDRFIPEEEAKISLSGDKVCFWVPNADKYQLSDISVYPRSMPDSQQKYMFGSDFKIINGELCIPPERWLLPEEGQFIARYFLTPVSSDQSFRKVTTGFEISNGEIKSIPLTNREVVR